MVYQRMNKDGVYNAGATQRGSKWVSLHIDSASLITLHGSKPTIEVRIMPPLPAFFHL